MTDGFILLHRKIKDNWLWKRSDYLHWFLHFLLLANFKDNDKYLFEGKFITVKRGQFVTSYRMLAKDLPKCSEQKIRTFIQLLIKDNVILIKSLQKATQITILNYESYQGEQHSSNTVATQYQHSSNTVVTTIETKKKKENKENKDKLHLFKNSIYFDFEVLKREIDIKYHSYDLKYYHQNMIDYSESKGAKYKNWLAACRSWINKDIKEGKANVNNNGGKLMKKWTAKDIQK